LAVAKVRVSPSQLGQTKVGTNLEIPMANSSVLISTLLENAALRRGWQCSPHDRMWGISTFSRELDFADNWVEPAFGSFPFQRSP